MSCGVWVIRNELQMNLMNLIPPNDLVFDVVRVFTSLGI